MNSPILRLLTCAAALSTPSLFAATSYWDTSATTGLQSGSGTWGTDSFWSSTTAGTTLGAWVPSNVAEFQGATNSASTITISSTQTVTGMNFVTTGGGGSNWGFTGTGGVVLGGASTVNLGTSGVLIGNVISGTGSLTVTGSASGFLRLDGVSTYTGATTLQSNANFIVNGTIASSVTVASTALLSGAGTINGAARVLSGGNISASSALNTAGSMNLSSLTLDGGSKMGWDVLSQTGAAGVGYDKLNVTGALDLSTLSSANKLQLVLAGTQLGNFDASKSGTFSILSYGSLNLGANGSLSGLYTIDTTGLKNTLGGTVNAANFNLINNTATKSLDLVYAAPVPEPSTYGIALGGLTLAVVAVRRRKDLSRV